MQGALILWLALFSIIFVHESGHVIAFRRIGMEIDEMAIGIPWGPRLTIRSAFLRRHLGPDFTLYLCPLILGGYVKPRDPERETKLPDDEKALVYGGGVIANIILYLAMNCVLLLQLMGSSAPHDVGIPMFQFLGKHDPGIILAGHVALAGLFIYFARFISRYIFPIIGLAIIIIMSYLLIKIFGNTAVLSGGGFVALAAQSKTANDGGVLIGYIGFLSIVVGLGNLMPLYPLDGGHIGMLHVQKFAPWLVPYYRRAGFAIVIFLMILQFVPDLYRLLN